MKGGFCSGVRRGTRACCEHKITPITLHEPRDTHASLCAKAGVPLEVVSQRLGHASIGITAERYLHVYSDRDADAARAFERLVGMGIKGLRYTGPCCARFGAVETVSAELEWTQGVME
jgi:integrase